MIEQFRLPTIFSDGMIIQHGVETSVWGTAPTDAVVKLNFADQEQAVVCSNGKWRACLPAVPPGGPYALTVSCGQEVLNIIDILAGEIWVAGGQSNMEWPLKTTLNYRKYIASANEPNIRFFNVQKLLYDGETDDNPEKFQRTSAWRQANSDNAGEFSAIGYHFACDLYQSFGIPVGIVECNLGGSSASAWTKEDWLLTDPDLKSYIDEYAHSVSQLNMQEFVPAAKKALLTLSKSSVLLEPEKENSESWSFERLPSELRQSILTGMQPSPYSPFGHPGSLYTTMVSTITPYTVKGVIFYQGESDDFKARIYSKLFSCLIDSWRASFENSNLPFLFVQLAAFGHDDYPEGQMYALLRDQQANVARTVPNTAMVVAMDHGSFHDIHPRNKQPLGHRLALAARAQVYGESIEWSGPVYKSMRINDNQIIIEFDHVKSGLMCHDEKIQGFRIAGLNRRYYDADAIIKDTSVVLSSPSVSMPAAASYGWANFMKVNLYNGEGLPAVPFMTDKFL